MEIYLKMDASYEMGMDNTRPMREPYLTKGEGKVLLRNFGFIFGFDVI